MKTKVLFRCDSSDRIGTGHFMRCLALAQALDRVKMESLFAASESADAAFMAFQLQKERRPFFRIEGRSGSRRDLDETLKLAGELKASWIVLDGYRFAADYQGEIKKNNFLLLVIDDDCQAAHYYADLVLNQNPGAKVSIYKTLCEPTTRLLLGSRYALLRKEFFRAKKQKSRKFKSRQRVLVTFGGGKHPLLTRKTLKGISQAKVKNLEVLQGVKVGPERMPSLMRQADVAIAGAGSTSLELAFMGIPSLLVSVAKNQRLNAQSLHRLGCAWNLGSSRLVSTSTLGGKLKKLLGDPHRLRRMSLKGQAAIDSQGALRVARVMVGQNIKIRPVHKGDLRRIWQWSNERSVRGHSFHPAPIPWKRHVEWFQEKLNDPSCSFFLATTQKGEPIGQVRYHVGGKEADISVSLKNNYRGCGYGQSLIRKASFRLFEKTAVEKIHAYIKKENGNSTRAFADAGFRRRGTTRVHGYPALHFMLSRPKSKIDEAPS